MIAHRHGNSISLAVAAEGLSALRPGTEGINALGRRETSCDLQALDRVYEAMHAGQVGAAMDELLPVLQERRLHASAADWDAYLGACLGHPLCGLLHQDPFTCRAFGKPRGYAGDAELLDFVYGREEGWPLPEATTDLGRKIFDYTTRSAACEAVRARRGFAAGVVDRLAEETLRPQVLSIAAGHLREALLSAAVKRRKFGRYVALDSDLRSLEEVKRCYGSFGVETMPGSVRQLLTRRLDLGGFDFVYSLGLYDYLSLAAAKRLTAVLFQMLRPRGRLLVANFLPGIPDYGYMESYMAWKLIYRTRQEVLEMSAEIPQSWIRDIHIFAEENQNILFLQITRT